MGPSTVASSCFLLGLPLKFAEVGFILSMITFTYANPGTKDGEDKCFR